MENEKKETTKTIEENRITLGALQLCSSPLQTLASAKLPVKNSYWVAKTLDRIKKELDRSEKLRIELIKKYGKPTEENGETFQVKDECIEDFQTEFKELLDIEVDNFKFTPIPLQVLEKASIELSAIEIGQLCKYGFVKGD